MAARILTLTLNPSIDVSTSTEVMRPEHKLRCGAARLDAGGGGVNVSRVVHELGAHTLAFFPQGGNTGTLLTQRLAEAGVAAMPIHIRSHTRVCMNISETSTGHEFRLVLPGAPLETDELSACLKRVEDELTHADILVASGSLPPGAPEDTFAQLARRVRSHGGRVVLDTSGAALRRSLGSGLFLVKPSRREFSELIGEPLEDLRTLAAACRRAHQSGAAEILVVSMGGEGAILTSSSGQWFAAPPSVEACSAVGAGDSFVAAMTLSLLRGESHDVALAWATAAGAAALLTPGTGLCRRSDVERLRRLVKVVPIESIRETATFNTSRAN